MRNRMKQSEILGYCSTNYHSYHRIFQEWLKKLIALSLQTQYILQFCKLA
jgi:hypothetical protein